jgi:hypothetical protein
MEQGSGVSRLATVPSRVARWPNPLDTAKNAEPAASGMCLMESSPIEVGAGAAAARGHPSRCRSQDGADGDDPVDGARKTGRIRPCRQSVAYFRKGGRSSAIDRDGVGSSTARGQASLAGRDSLNHRSRFFSSRSNRDSPSLARQLVTQGCGLGEASKYSKTKRSPIGSYSTVSISCLQRMVRVRAMQSRARDVAGKRAAE